MNYLAENLRFLTWASKQQTKNVPRTYPEHIATLASKCQMSTERYTGILAGTTTATADEIQDIELAFHEFDEDRIPHIHEDYMFRNEIERRKQELIKENILYLLNSIPWGNNQEFIEALEIQASTLTRWKSGKMNPSKYYQTKICKYFGAPDPENLKTAFLFLGLSPTTVAEKKVHLKNLLDAIDREKLESLYPALVKLLE